MKLFITAKPNAHQERIEQVNATHFVVSVTEPPVQGKANRAIVKALANHFHVPPSAVAILHGHTSKHKTIEVELA